MPHYFHRGLGDMLMRQVELVSLTSMGGRGALHNWGCSCQTVTLVSLIISSRLHSKEEVL